jgi:lysozyme
MDWLPYAMALVMPWEGCEKRKNGVIVPYLDRLAKPNVWTRGYGRTYGISEASPAITLLEAKQELAIGLRAYGNKCLLLAPILATKPKCMAAVGSWAWNCGTGAFKVSRLRKAINQGRWADAASLISKPNTAGGVVLRGLTRRRVSEQKMFLSGI